MSLTTIPNQPINFQSPEVIAACPDTEPPLLVSESDPLIFQFLQERCDDAEQFLAPIDPNDWIDNPGWTIGTGSLSLVVGNGGQEVEESLWVATIGDVYEVEIFVDSVSGDGVFVKVGGNQRAINAPGLHRFSVGAATASYAKLEAISDNSAIVITRFEVWEANRQFTVAIVQNGSDFATFDPLSDPEYFEFVGQHVVFNAPFPEFLEGCFNIELRDECGAYPVTYCSQALEVIPCGNTVMVRVCLDYDGLGFVAGYFTARLRASLVNPTWEYDTAQERLSNGRINRHYIDRQAVYQFSIETASQFLHPFLAALPMFDHFYIGETEWSVDVETYAPDYGDGRVSTGAVVLTVRKQKELMRRVLCDDLGEGCNPANDPICPTANAVLSTVLSEGSLFVRVDIFSMLGFVVSSIEWTVNGVDQDSISVGGVPGAYALGDVVPGDVVVVTFTNATDPECNDTRASYVVQNPCEFLDFPEGAQYFSFDYVQPGGGQINISPDYSIEPPDIYITMFVPGLGLVTEYQAVAIDNLPSGAYCVYSSDSEGVPIAANWKQLLFGDGNNPGDGVNITNVDISGVTLEDNEDAAFSFTNVELVPDTDFVRMPFLVFISANGCPTPVTITGIAALKAFEQRISGLTSAPSFVGLPNIQNLSMDGNNLPISEVNRVLVEGSANFTSTSGDIDLSGQTPSATPFGAGLTAKAELEGRSPGWTVTTD
jgi:hypothetical protein